MNTEKIGFPVARAQMLIRRPVAEVFEAFVDPEITTRFWFSKSSGRIEPGKRVRWEWEMFGVSADVNVLGIEQDKRIAIEWDEPPCPVEWRFEMRGSETTYVTIVNSGFRGSEEEKALQAIDATGGFTMVLAGLKALLEHGIELNLVADQFPDGCLK